MAQPEAESSSDSPETGAETTTSPAERTAEVEVTEIVVNPNVAHTETVYVPYEPKSFTALGLAVHDPSDCW